MMEELRELYQETILDHNKNPRNYGKLEPHTHMKEGYNPLCGDHFFIYLNVKDDRVTDIRFEGSGCAISKSSASVMTTVVKGKTVQEVDSLFQTFHQLVAGESGKNSTGDLGKLAVFSGVREFPARVKCASLAWHTVQAALMKDDQPVSTE